MVRGGRKGRVRSSAADHMPMGERGAALKVFVVALKFHRDRIRGGIAQ